MDRPSLSIESQLVDADICVDWGLLSGTELITLTNETVVFEELYRVDETGDITVLVFLSDFTSFATVTQVMNYVSASKELKAARTRVCFIGPGSRVDSKLFVERFEEIAKLPGRVYADESSSAFKACGMKKVANMKSLGFISSLTKRGKPATLVPVFGGGTLVVKSELEKSHFRPELLAGHRNENATDAFPVKSVLEACGVDNAKDMVITDFMKPLVLKARFNDLFKVASDDKSDSSASIRSLPRGSATMTRGDFAEDRGENIFI
mmetsp:Transcript_13875/g.28432  ORF Transcript_13875/g.28432 Transcript_13875/m.28432 type:complete len:265 (-) Transcript_13875:33-827(-)